MRSKGLELLNQVLGDLGRMLNGGMSSSAQGRVDLGSPVDDIGDDGLG